MKCWTLIKRCRRGACASLEKEGKCVFIRVNAISKHGMKDMDGLNWSAAASIASDDGIESIRAGVWGVIKEEAGIVKVAGV